MYHEAYGSTEIGNFLMMDHDEELWAWPGHYGQPLVRFDVVVCGEDDELPPTWEVGELLVRRSTELTGFFEKPVLQNELFHLGG